MGRRKKLKPKKEEIAEDWCFLCKDGGMLIICDHKDCLKAYHPECIEKDESLLKTDKKWTCNWHFCCLCNRNPKFHCFCCPTAVCGHCLYGSDFIVVRRRRGFCSDCLELALKIEENKDANSNGQSKLDSDTQDTEAFYFYGYWEKIKKEESLTLKHLNLAHKRLKKGKNYSFTDSCGHEEDEEYVAESENESQVSGSDNSDLSDTEANKQIGKRKRSKEDISEMKKKAKMEFVGWASKRLMEFLTFLGKDTTDELTEYDVTGIINEYCKDNNLFDAEKKRKVNCDARLQSLLGRKSVNKNSISRVIAKHFADNWDDSEDEIEAGLEKKDEDVGVVLKKQKTSRSVVKPDKEEKEVAPYFEKSEFASVIPENIKLVYLRKSLVMELAKELETFDEKVMGSFVRVKRDPNDCMQRNPYLIVQVKAGIKKDSNPDSEILLQLSNMVNEVPVSKLSDIDFSKEECEDLSERINNGLLQRPTVVELEKKAKILHEDITKHWIARELVTLQNKISRANEKGWRREMAEYMDRRMLLQTPAEQSRLLNKAPKVIADLIGIKMADENSMLKEELAKKDSLKAFIPKIDATGPKGAVEERGSPFLKGKQEL